jgi:hypothetical protein
LYPLIISTAAKALPVKERRGVRQVIVIGALLLLAVISCTGFLVYQHALAHHRACFRSYLSAVSDDRLYKIVIHPSELFVDSERLHWEDDNREIIYKETRCDIVSIQSQGTSVRLLVIPDHEEENLKKQFSRDDRSAASTPYLKLLTQLLDLKYVHEHGFVFRSFEKPKPSFGAYLFSLPLVFMAPRVLPPKPLL